MHSLVLLAFFFASTVTSHSWLECTDYDVGSSNASSLDLEYWNKAKCHGYARGGQTQASVEFGIDTGFDYRPSLVAPCQWSRGTVYTEEAPQATYTPGQRVCLAYPSKNHVASATTNPYIPDSGIRIRRTSRDALVDDFSEKDYSHLNGVHVNGEIDYKGFQNCPKFDENNDKALCTVCFDLEADLAPGLYSFQWQWSFNAVTDAYTSCWEAQVE